MVIDNLGAIVIAFDEDAVEFVGSDSDIFADDCLAEKLLVGAADDSIVFVSLDFVEGYHWECAIDLYPFLILEDHVTTDLWLACQTHLHSGFVF